ncbi:peptidylprolyl isomerase [Rhizobium sp. AN80A]|uniref:peptidylprolyl isomerase n=1 Tax=Rhizobium sp. AN80A TaxID=3040673 RepID=UPI0024B36846|nr:peptidylprolyl isomerase [Rhizobium sp. AN80A]
MPVGKTRDQEGTKSFEDEAKTSSQDASSRANGGDLGFLAEDPIPPEFIKAAASAAPGEVVASPRRLWWDPLAEFEERRGNPVPVYDKVP